MSRGKKTRPEKIYEIFASYATTASLTQTSKACGVPVSTVKKVIDEHRDDPDFVKLQEKAKAEFSVAASAIIDKGLLLLRRRFDRAIEQEEMLDMFIDEIATTNKVQLSAQEKTVLITKLRGLQLHDVKAITTAIGTLFDKKALADGQPTTRVDVIGDDMLAKLAELAGYERKS